MLRDWCTWDDEYNAVVQDIRARLVALATRQEGYTSVLMQGSGTFCVEAAVGTAVPRSGKLLVLANGAYGERMAAIAGRAGIPVSVLRFAETSPVDPRAVQRRIEAEPALTHVGLVHCETTTGMLNPLEAVGQVVRGAGLRLLVDAMSSFGGIPFDMGSLGIDWLVSSANKCIQGVPGFGFVIARVSELEQCTGRAHSLSLDLHDQWRTMETGRGKWRFTSPTHAVRAFAQALAELEQEGGPGERFLRYSANHRILVRGMEALGFSCLLPPHLRSPIITAFRSPAHPGYDFALFSRALKGRGFVIYPGKASEADCFRVGTIGDVRPRDMHGFLAAVRRCMSWDEPFIHDPAMLFGA
jgi:2-aminoethylphosphonate-pyruvate transaminase